MIIFYRLKLAHIQTIQLQSIPPKLHDMMCGFYVVDDIITKKIGYLENFTSSQGKKL